MASEHISITLYIHALGGGPISPMILDMLEVEIAVVSLPAAADRDEARVREIANRIKKVFPNVDPTSKLRELKWLIGRLANVTMFDGIVLDMPGTIDGPSTPKNPAVQEFQKLTEETLRLKGQFEDITQQYQKAQAQIKKLLSEKSRLQSAQQTQARDLNQVRTELESIKTKDYHAQVDVKKYQEQASKLEQEKAALQTQLEKAKLEQQAARKAQLEVATLREQMKNAADTEQQLRSRIKKLELELADLKEHIRRLAENASSANADQARSPWLD